MVTDERSAAVAECVKWLDRILLEKKFSAVEKVNAGAFRKALMDGTLDDHAGQYIYIQNGEIFQTSYADASSFFHDTNCNSADANGLLYHVPEK
jgi:hypothetical protein